MENQTENQNLNTPQTPVQEQAVEPKSPFWKSKWAVLGILLLIILVPAGFFTLGKITSKPSPTPTPMATPTPVDETANWKTYEGIGFTLKYPFEFTILEKPFNTIMDHNIVIDKTMSNTSSLNCKGDCPVVNEKQTVSINSYHVNKIKGYIGSIGGNIPQSYVAYELKDPLSNKYLKVTLYELPWDQSYEDQVKQYSEDRIPSPIPAIENEVLMQILSTFKFTNSSDELTSLSPNGIKKLVLRTKDLENSEAECKIFLIDLKSESEKLISSTIGGPASGCPSFNKKSWSPTEKYFYIGEGGPDYVNAIIYKTNGSKFLNGETSIDIYKFLKNKTGYYLDAGYSWNKNDTLFLKTVGERFSKGPDYNLNFDTLELNKI